ncbi:MAG: ABC transporter ATP-binding protein [Ardenticatenales bacterium]|jgi:ABC-type multidrug transport system ATPase subunit|nr:ABC transporter ATP-binding protein [Ardenticatenales bacterium]
MIFAQDLTVRLGGTTVLDGLALDVPAGGGLALWGTNGAGKTTALRAMLGLLPFGGTVRLGGHDVRRDGRSARAQVGYVPQQLAFWDDLGTLECLQWLARLRRAPIERAAELLERVSLAEHGRKRIGELSGGMKQRMALAAALLGDPPILLLDEPTANLDAAGRADLLALLADLRGAGKTLLVTTHRLSEVHALADHVIVLEAGEVRLSCGADVLEAALYPYATLRLVVAPADEAAALAALAKGGFKTHANRHGILVRVAAGRRAAPVEVLVAADVALEDLWVEDSWVEDGAWTLG